jgi:hypothetical protein
MGIQINAATRLNAARADESQAKKYIESLGLRVHKVENSRNGRIQFLLEKIALNDAVELISKKLGKPDLKGPDWFSWYNGRDRRVTIEYVFGTIGKPILTLDDAGT